MSEIRRTFFADSVSSANVQLRRDPKTDPAPDASPGLEILQANLVMAGDADTAFWQATCLRYEVIIRRLT